MAISNMQQARQLRAGGGIMDLEPRQGYFLGKLVKKVTRPLKKIVKSPLGKAALIGGLGMYGMGAGPFSGVKGSGFLRNLIAGKALPFKNMTGSGGVARSGGLRGMLSKLNPFSDKMSFGQKAFLGGTAALTALPFFMGGGEDEGEIVGDEFDITPDTISNIRDMSRRKDSSLDPFRIPERFAQKNYYLPFANGGVVGLANGGGAGEQQMMQALQAEYAKYRQQGGTMPFEQFAKLVMQQQQQPQMAANGGRIGYQDAGPVMQEEVINEDTQEVVSNPDPLAELNALSLEVFGKPYDMLNEGEQEALMNFMSQNPEEEIIDTDQTMVEDRVMAADGGMMDYMSSANPMADSYLMEDTDIINMYRPSGNRQMAAEGGIMDLGGMEKDYREEGGFVPIGGQEKADDVPARLSKNEFVFTADAVRNAGGGDIDKGSAVMQRMMDNLEQGGEISEESQGMNPAQEMFDTAQQLESRIE
jgi:hypothetical protein